MVPALPRRGFLAAAGTLAASLGGGAVLAATTDQQEPGDWPMVQHDPAGRSHAPTASPPKDDVAVRWKRQIDAGRGFAYGPTPVVADGTVYVPDRDLLALDVEDGSVRYRADGSTNRAIAVAPARAYTSPTLALAGTSQISGLHASGGLDLFGSRVASTRWEASTQGSDTVFFGDAPNQSPPVAANGTVVASLAGRLVAVDASSGRVRWEVPVDTRRPAVHDGVVYAANYPDGVVGYDLASGEQTFEATVRNAPPLGVTAGPDELVVATSDGLAGLTYDGIVRWRFEPEDLSRDYGAVALADGVAYAGFRGDPDNQLVAVDVSDGTELWRSGAAPESTPQFAPPAVADGVVYLPLEDWGFAAVDAADGSVRWQFEPSGDAVVPWSPAALVGETLYAIGNGHVYALEEA